MLDRDQFARKRKTGFLLGLADRDHFRGLAGVDQAGGHLDLPGRFAGEQRRQPKLLDQHDLVAVGIIQHHRDGPAAPQHVIGALGAPPAGKQAMTEAKNVDPQKALESFGCFDDLDIAVSGRSGFSHAAAPVAAAAAMFRGRRTVNSVNSPSRLSTLIVPPCSWTTMS